MFFKPIISLNVPYLFIIQWYFPRLLILLFRVIILLFCCYFKYILVLFCLALYLYCLVLILFFVGLLCLCLFVSLFSVFFRIDLLGFFVLVCFRNEVCRFLFFDLGFLFRFAFGLLLKILFLLISFLDGILRFWLLAVLFRLFFFLVLFDLCHFLITRIFDIGNLIQFVIYFSMLYYLLFFINLKLFYCLVHVKLELNQVLMLETLNHQFYELDYMNYY